MSRRPLPLVLLLLVLAVAAAGCQLADQPRPAGTADSGTGAGDDDAVLGSPAEEWPRTLAGIRAFAEPEALTWQDEPVLADLTVFLDDGRWERVRATYVAAEAERLLTYRSSPDTLRLERPRLEGLRLPILPAAAVLAIEPFPADALEPAALADAARPALAECDAGDDPVEAVLYATGAPEGWDGSTWTRTPSWRATVVATTAAVVVEPTTGAPYAPLTCLEPILLQGEGG